MNSKTVSKRGRGIMLAAAVAAAVTAALLCRSTKASAVNGTPLAYCVRSQELSGTYYDHVDSKGYRHIVFETDVPRDLSDYAIVFDAEAPVGENIYVIDEEETLMKLGSPLDEEECGLAFSDSEICFFEGCEIIPVSEAYPDGGVHNWGGIRGGAFLYQGEAAHKNESHSVSRDENDADNTARITYEIEYYVGK